MGQYVAEVRLKNNVCKYDEFYLFAVMYYILYLCINIIDSVHNQRVKFITCDMYSLIYHSIHFFLI